AVAINKSEPIGVAVSGNPEREFLVEQELAHLGQIPLRRFGAVAAEEHVAIIMNRVDFTPAPPQNLVQITAAGPPQRLISKLQLPRSDFRESNFGAEVIQIIFARVKSYRRGGVFSFGLLSFTCPARPA